MTLVSLSTFRNAVRALAPLAPIPTVDRAIRSSAIDFCRLSEAIRETITAVTLVAGQNVASLGLSNGLRATALKEARYDSSELGLTSPRDLSLNMPDWDSRSGDPELIYLSSGAEVTVAPIPATTDPTNLKLVVAVEPTYDASKVPAELADAYFQAVVDGALGHLFEMVGSDWGDVSMANAYKTRAMGAALEAKNRADHNSTRRRRTVKYGGY